LNKKGVNFFLVIIAIIIGSALWEQFRFHPFKFGKPAFAIVFAASIYFLVIGIGNLN